MAKNDSGLAGSKFSFSRAGSGNETKQLTYIGERIQALAGSTEGEFLSLGRNLRGLAERSLELSTLGRESAELLSGSTMTGAVDLLSDVVERMKGQLIIGEDHRRRSLAAVERARDEIRVARRVFEDFKPVHRSLRMLGTMTRIESARLVGADQSFGFLADEVTRQSQSMADKSEDVLDRLEGLGEQIHEAEVRLEFLGRTGADREMTQAISASLSGLLTRQASAAAGVEKMRARAEDISGRMNEVVTRLQFHDIVRQQMEHVYEALAAVAPQASESEVNGVVRLQVAHLRRASNELVQAVGGIVGHLEAMAGDVTTMARAAVEFSGGRGDGSSFLWRLERDISKTLQGLVKHQQALSEVLAAMATVAETLEAMGNFLKDVEEIGRSIRFIALNATIQAARVGLGGAALDRLALAIRETSSQAQTQSKAVAEVLVTLSALAAEMRGGAATTDEVSHVSEDLARIVGTISRANETADGLLIRVDCLGRDLGRDILAAARAIHVQDRVEKEIGQAIRSLVTLIGVDASSVVDTEQIQTLASMASRYTMDRERQTHAALVSRGFGPLGGPSAGPGTPAGDGDDLGDNVELF